MATPRTARPLRERQREEREQFILDAAQALLLEKGYHEMSMDEIAARVGIAKGTVYLHFPGKEELMFALITRDMGNFIETIDQRLAETATPHEQLVAITTYLMRAVFGARFQAMIAISQQPELRARFIEHKAQFVSQRQQLEERLGRIFDAGKARGDFDATMPTPIMISLFETMVATQRHQQMLMEQQLPVDEVIAQSIRFFFKGIAAATPQKGND
jgi:TetR/AcrR family transcriptional regulator, fatty acid metabolism regulator protein